MAVFIHGGNDVVAFLHLSSLYALPDEGEKDGRKTKVQGSISQIVNIFAIVPKKEKKSP